MGAALSPSLFRGEGWGEGRVLATEPPTSVGAHPVRDRGVAAYLITAIADRDNRASPRSRTGCAPTQIANGSF